MSRQAKNKSNQHMQHFATDNMLFILYQSDASDLEYGIFRKSRLKNCFQNLSDEPPDKQSFWTS